MAETYLGIVETAHKRSQQQVEPRGGYALLRPLYRSSEDLSEWIPVEQSDFPNRGAVTWYDPPPDLAKDSLWHFQVQESRTYRADNPNHDRFFALNLIAAREVIDLRLDDKPFVLDDARREVVEEGIELQFAPSQQVHLWIDDDALTSPVHLIRHGNKWRVSTDQIQQTFIKVYSIPQKKIVELRAGGARRAFLAPDTQTGAPTQQLDWSSDDVLLKRVLKWLQEADKDFAHSVDLTRRAVSRAADIVRGTQSETGETALRKQQLQRALALASVIEENDELRHALEEDLLNLPSVIAKIKDAVDEERQEAREQIRREESEAASSVAALRVEKASLEQEMKELEQRRAELSLSLQRQVEESKAAVEAALEEQMSELMNRPAQALANISIFRAALNLAPSTNSSNAHAPRQLTAGDAVPGRSILSLRFVRREKQIKLIADQQNLRTALNESHAAAGVDSGAAATLHAAFLSGMMPVLSGSAAYEAVKSYASRVAGGRLLWVPVSATTLEPNDLLGRFDAASQNFAPHPNGLLDLLLHARKSDELFIVVLDGFNRAPVDSYLSPLLSMFDDAWLEEHERRALPLVHQRSVNAEDPYAAATRLTWVPNVLLAGIWSEGAATLPVPASFWDAAAFVTTEQASFDDAAVDNSNRHETNSDAELSELTLEAWRDWRDEGARKKATPQLRKLTELLTNMEAPLGGLRQSKFITFYTAMREWTQNENNALRTAAVCCLAPRAAALGQDAQLVKAIEDVVGTDDDFERIMQTTRLLLS